MTPALIAVERIKSVFMSNDPNPAKRVALAGGLLPFMARKVFPVQE